MEFDVYISWKWKLIISDSWRIEINDTEVEGLNYIVIIRTEIDDKES